MRTTNNAARLCEWQPEAQQPIYEVGGGPQPAKMPTTQPGPARADGTFTSGTTGQCRTWPNATVCTELACTCPLRQEQLHGGPPAGPCVRRTYNDTEPAEANAHGECESLGNDELRCKRTTNWQGLLCLWVGRRGAGGHCATYDANAIGEGEWLPPCRQYWAVVPGQQAIYAPRSSVMGLPDPGLDGAAPRTNADGDDWGGNRSTAQY